jgi:type II secretory pathway pseudopilin PulG
MNAGRRSRGFTLIGMLLAVAALGGGLAAYGELTSHAAQREKEQELLFVGNQIRQAIGAYYERSPGGARRFPQKLDDLLEDKRYPMPQRYLRALYADPMTGKPDWVAVAAPTGGIMGVHSASEARPIKSRGFLARDMAFADAARYADWQFSYAPR